MFKSVLKRCCSQIIIVIFIQVMLLSVFAGRAEAVNPDSINTACDKLLGYYNRVDNCNAWEVIGMRWATVECSNKYAPENAASASDYARNIMGAIAGRQDAAVINASIAELGAMQNADGSFVNGDNTSLNQTIWAVIALDFAHVNGFAVNYQRDDAISFICSCQDAGGGFDESGGGVDIDSTAHALIALAADYQQPGKDAVTTTINTALAYLKEQQLSSGGFGSWGSESPDSIAAIIEALAALGIDPLANEWLKDGNNMVDALLAYQSNQGWFVYSWEPSGWNDTTVPNRMSTYHALLALGDLVQGQSKYHTLLPDTINLVNPGGVSDSLPEAQQSKASVSTRGDAGTDTVLPNTSWNPAGSFTGSASKEIIKEKSETPKPKMSLGDIDTTFDWAREAIESLAAKGIITGTGRGYEPARSISRAEILELLVRAKGVNIEKADPGFKDVNEDDWCYAGIATASRKGWISGYPDSTFRPFNPVSRTEAACLLNCIFPADTRKTNQVNASFSDMNEIPGWAREAVVNLQSRGILSGYPDGSFTGEGKLSRAEAAVIIYKLIR